MSKYDPLFRFFHEETKNRITRSFEEIERIVGFKLPESAKSYPAWWRNTKLGHSQSDAWLANGWKISELSISRQIVTFERERSSKKRITKNIKSNPQPHHTPSLNLSVASVSPLTEVSLKMIWHSLGPVVQNSGGKLEMPPAPTAPAIYRFRILKDGQEERYIGETINIRRRLYHYINPGPSQTTNVRVNALFHSAVDNNATIEIDVVLDGVFLGIENMRTAPDLKDKATRRLLENAAILVDGAAQISGLNL